MNAANTRAVIARSGIGVQVRAGSQKPDIGTGDAFKRALLNVKSSAYLKVGSGVYLEGGSGDGGGAALPSC